MRSLPPVLAPFLLFVAACGQSVGPDGSAELDSTADVFQPDAQLTDRFGPSDVPDAFRPDVPTDANAPDVDGAADVSIVGFEPARSVVVPGRACHDLPFTDPVAVRDDPGVYPFPLRGGPVADGTYRLMRVDRYLEGRPLGSRVNFNGTMLRIRGSIWEFSLWAIDRAPEDRTVGSFYRLRFVVRREREDFFSWFLDCPTELGSAVIMDSYETDGATFRIGSGDEVFTYMRE